MIVSFATTRGRFAPAPFLLLIVLASACGGATTRAAPDSGSQNQIQWEPIKSWSGRGSQYLDSFPSEGALRFEWETKAVSGTAQPGAFRVVVHSSISGRPLAAPIIDQRGEGKGTAYFSEEPRVFFLNVSSENLEWKIAVSERVR